MAQLIIRQTHISALIFEEQLINREKGIKRLCGDNWQITITKVMLDSDKTDHSLDQTCHQIKCVVHRVVCDWQLKLTHSLRNFGWQKLNKRGTFESNHAMSKVDPRIRLSKISTTLENPMFADMLLKQSNTGNHEQSRDHLNYMKWCDKVGRELLLCGSVDMIHWYQVRDPIRESRV